MRRNYKVFIFLACLPALAGAASLAPANAQSPAASSPQTVASVDYVDQSLRWCINSKCPAGRWPHAQQDQKLVYGNYVYKDKGQETGLRAASGNKTWTMAPAEQVLASVQKYVATYPPDPQTLHGNIATVTALPNVSAGLLLRRGEVYEEVLRGSVGVVQAGGAVSVADAVNDVAQLDVSVLGNRTAFTVFTGMVRVQFRGRMAFVGPGHQVIAQGGTTLSRPFPAPPTTTRGIETWMSRTPPVPDSTQLPPAEVSVPYSAQINPVGGVPPYLWEAAPQGLPPGLRFSQSDATVASVSGVPQAAGQYAFAVRLGSKNGNATVHSITLPVVPPLIIATDVLQSSRACQPFHQVVTAEGGLGPYTWALASNDSVIPGLAVVSDGSATATLTGQAHGPGGGRIIVQVTDALGGHTERTYSFKVASCS